MAFPRQEYWNGLPFPSPGHLPDPGIEPASPVSPTLQEGSLPTEPSGKPRTRKGMPNSSHKISASAVLNMMLKFQQKDWKAYENK